MKRTYDIEGMTCGNCVASVQSALEKVPGVKKARVDLAKKLAVVETERVVPPATLQAALPEKYKIQSRSPKVNGTPLVTETQTESELARLYPLFLIFAFLIGGVLLYHLKTGNWNVIAMMQHFMGGFFVVFSFFKLLDVKGFAYSFSMYDPLAKRWLGYGFVYPFIELALGIGFLWGWNLPLLSIMTLIVLGISSVGVAQSVFNKRKIQCACLGTVLDLPMTKVTLIENSLMITMALGMILQMGL